MNEDMIQKHLERLRKLEDRLYNDKQFDSSASVSIAIDIIELLLKSSRPDWRQDDKRN